MAIQSAMSNIRCSKATSIAPHLLGGLHFADEDGPLICLDWQLLNPDDTSNLEKGQLAKQLRM
jgi:hypothetical protein